MYERVNRCPAICVDALLASLLMRWSCVPYRTLTTPHSLGSTSQVPAIVACVIWFPQKNKTSLESSLSDLIKWKLWSPGQEMLELRTLSLAFLIFAIQLLLQRSLSPTLHGHHPLRAQLKYPFAHRLDPEPDQNCTFSCLRPLLLLVYVLMVLAQLGSLQWEQYLVGEHTSVYTLSRLINLLHFIPHEDFVMILR